jgi:gluconate 2-dehydrogenase gamma chain
MPFNPSRRRFLSKGASAAGAAMVGISLPQFLAACRDAEDARQTDAAFKMLSSAQATELDAIAACIVPTTDTPGAREAGSIYFMDTLLGGRRPDLLAPIETGLADLSARVQAASAGADRFSDLDEETQIAVLTDLEDSDFFYTVRLLTLAGMLADPSYGGNIDGVGWKLIGFDGHFASTPPFGYYDAHYTPGEVGNDG